MAKSKDENTEIPAVKTKRSGKVKLLVFLAAATAGLVWAAENPQIRQQITSSFKAKTPVDDSEINLLQRQISELQQKVHHQSLEDLSRLNERFEALEKNNLNIIDSKADIAAFVGLTTRMDKLEHEIQNAVKVTDEGALVLTAVMLVKDSADQGGVFEYEAEVLQQITADNPALKEPVEQIISLAKEGVPARQYLQYRFNEVCTNLMVKEKQEEEESLTWKQRLNAKLGEFVQVKKTNRQEKEEASLEVVKKLVAAGELSKALAELSLTSNASLLANPEMEKWYNQARQRETFDRAVSRIAASSLAAMKVNFIKKQQ